MDVCCVFMFILFYSLVTFNIQDAVLKRICSCKKLYVFTVGLKLCDQTYPFIYFTFELLNINYVISIHSWE